MMGQVVDTETLLERIESSCPDTVLIGWELPGQAGLLCLPALCQACPGTFIIVLSGQPDARQAALAAHRSTFRNTLLDRLSQWDCAARTNGMLYRDSL